MVRFADASRLRTYTSLVFSTAATMSARPRGSHATYAPGTARRHPVFPNTSQCATTNAFDATSKSSTLTAPESDPTTTRSTAAPVSRNGARHRTTLNVGVRATLTTFPVVSSGRSSSSAPPCRATTISRACGPLNDP